MTDGGTLGPVPILSRDRHRWIAVRRLRDVLRAELVSGQFGCGSLPGEPQLVEQYDVSRGVVRRALDLLRSEGMIERLPGAGTFVVAPERVLHGIHVLQGLSDGIEGGKSRIDYRIVDLRAVAAPRIIASRLDLGPGAEAVYFERLTVLDGHPLQLRSSWLPRAIAGPMLSRGYDLRVSIYHLLEQQLGHTVSHSDQQIEATQADAGTAPLLGIPVGAPILLLERLVHLADGHPGELSFGRFRGDRISLTDVMRRRPNPR